MAAAVTELGALETGSHVCWLVQDDQAYAGNAAALLRDGARAGERPVAFGPAGSASLGELAAVAALAVDPWVEFLDRWPVDVQVMSAVFRRQTALAREGGRRGVRVVADMDWLLSSKSSNEEIVGFELLLDRVVAELDATVICAYRATSFSPELIDGVLAVHPACLAQREEPQFRFIAAGTAGWRLSGEVDLAVHPAFAAALSTAASSGSCVIDVTDLEFIDVAGLRLLAKQSLIHGVGVALCGASPTLRRTWQLCGFDELAPGVQLG